MILATEQLSSYLRERPAQLRKLKGEGTRIIGFFVGDYVPEEMIYASGAVPLCLCHGGDPMSDDKAVSMSPSKGFRGNAGVEQVCGECHPAVQEAAHFFASSSGHRGLPP